MKQVINSNGNTSATIERLNICVLCCKFNAATNFQRHTSTVPSERGTLRSIAFQHISAGRTKHVLSSIVIFPANEYTSQHCIFILFCTGPCTLPYKACSNKTSCLIYGQAAFPLTVTIWCKLCWTRACSETKRPRCVLGTKLVGMSQMGYQEVLGKPVTRGRGVVWFIWDVHDWYDFGVNLVGMTRIGYDVFQIWLGNSYVLEGHDSGMRDSCRLKYVSDMTGTWRRYKYRMPIV